MYKSVHKTSVNLIK